jgi:hypothetical protein
VAISVNTSVQMKLPLARGPLLRHQIGFKEAG